MNTRKILVILIVFLLVSILGLGVWNLFFTKTQRRPEGPKEVGEAPVEVEQETATPKESFQHPSGQAPEAPEETAEVQKKESILPKPKVKERKSPQGRKIKQLTDKPVLGATIAQDGRHLLYYHKKDGNVFQLSFDGADWQRISDTYIHNLKKVLWAPTKDKVITIREKDGKEIKGFYDYNTGKYAELDSRMKKITWSPDGKKILYHFLDPQGTSNIAFSNPDGSQWQPLLTMKIGEVKIDWPRKDFITVLSPGTEYYASTLYQLYFENLDNEKAIVRGLSLEEGVNWAKGGGAFLYKRDPQGSLLLYNMDAGTQTLKINTAVSQCSWAQDNKTIYCAVPTGNIQEILPKHYAAKALPKSDSFWKIDLEAEEIVEILIPQSQKNVTKVKEGSLLVSPDEDYLFWVDAGTDKLYSLKL